MYLLCCCAYSSVMVYFTLWQPLPVCSASAYTCSDLNASASRSSASNLLQPQPYCCLFHFSHSIPSIQSHFSRLLPWDISICLFTSSSRLLRDLQKVPRHAPLSFCFQQRKTLSVSLMLNDDNKELIRSHSMHLQLLESEASVAKRDGS